MDKNRWWQIYNCCASLPSMCIETLPGEAHSIHSHIKLGQQPMLSQRSHKCAPRTNISCASTPFSVRSINITQHDKVWFNPLKVWVFLNKGEGYDWLTTGVELSEANYLESVPSKFLVSMGANGPFRIRWEPMRHSRKSPMGGIEGQTTSQVENCDILFE